MIRTATAILALLYLALPSPSMAKSGAKSGPRTLSDYNIQKEPLATASGRGRYFHGFTTRMTSSRPGTRHYFPGVTHYPRIRLERAPFR